MLAARRAEILDAWFAETLRAFSARTAHLVTTELDRFRNPAGYLLRENLAALFDAALLSDDWDRAGHALAELVRLQAVQECAEDRAIGFVAALKGAVARAVPDCRLTAGIDARIDRMTGLASDMYAERRRQMTELAAKERRRRTWVLNRVRARRG